MPLNLAFGAPPNEPTQITQTATDTQASATVVKNATDQVNSMMTAANGATTVLQKIDLDAISATGGLTALAKVVAGTNSPAFTWVEGEVASALANIDAQPTVKTSVETTLTASNTVNTINGGGSLQNVFVRDSTRTLNIQVYWDQLFGTFAYQEIPAAMGTFALTSKQRLRWP